jgi:L,D-transpeptidase ErfK/SrfK
MKIPEVFAVSVLLSVMVSNVCATTYDLPENSHDNVITQFQDDVPLTRVEQNETLLDVARRFALGQTEIVRLNPELERWHIKKMRLSAWPTNVSSPTRRGRASP